MLGARGRVELTCRAAGGPAPRPRSDPADGRAPARAAAARGVLWAALAASGGAAPRKRATLLPLAEATRPLWGLVLSSRGDCGVESVSPGSAI